MEKFVKDALKQYHELEVATKVLSIFKKQMVTAQSIIDLSEQNVKDIQDRLEKWKTPGGPAGRLALAIQNLKPKPPQGVFQSLF